ncbi:hypothetical protein [uncultured Bradyrhizobium sp.]|uniref:hypothetical protein n=1 Tax=uncultured Bradyrhizobium sp. TaxID=199684 RepID=UPI0035CB2341
MGHSAIKRSGILIRRQQLPSLDRRLRARWRATPPGKKLANGSGDAPCSRRFDLIETSFESDQPLITLPEVFHQSVQRLPRKTKLPIKLRSKGTGLAHVQIRLFRYPAKLIVGES